MALLVIDLQSAMFDGVRLPPIHDGPALLERVAQVLIKARAAHTPVIFIRHDGGAGDVLEAGTPGWQIHSAISPWPGERIIDKKRPDAFQGTELQSVLTAGRVGEVTLVGAQTEFCIDTTCRRAFSLGYTVRLVSDGHSTWDNGVLTADQTIRHHNNVLGDGFARLVTAETVKFHG